MQLPLITCFFLLFVFSCSPKKSADAPASAEDDFTEVDVSDLKNELLKSYRDTLHFESFHQWTEGKTLRVTGRYFCLNDSAIIIPGRYNLSDTTREFTTHNFVEEIIGIADTDTVFYKVIDKSIFNSTLPDYLKQYAILLEPKLEGADPANKSLEFSFSISIPLTDVGESRGLRVFEDGKTEVFIQR